MTSVSKNAYIDKLDDIVNKYKNTYHNTIKMKTIDVKPNTWKKLITKIQNLKLVMLLEYQNKNIFAKVYTPNFSEEVFMIKKVRNTISWTNIISDLKREEIFGTFYENELQKANQKKIRIEKVIKRKGNKLYVKWKDYDSSFNSWIDKKDVV